MAKQEREWVKRALRAAQEAIDAGQRVNMKAQLKEERTMRARDMGAAQAAQAPLETGGVGGPSGAMEGHRTTGDPDMDWIVQRESGFKTSAQNPTSSAFGVGQLIRSNRERFGRQFGYDPDTTDFTEQVNMFRAYIADRYGSPAAARRFWEQHGWY